VLFQDDAFDSLMFETLLGKIATTASSFYYCMHLRVVTRMYYYYYDTHI